MLQYEQFIYFIVKLLDSVRKTHFYTNLVLQLLNLVSEYQALLRFPSVYVIKMFHFIYICVCVHTRASVLL